MERGEPYKQHLLEITSYREKYKIGMDIGGYIPALHVGESTKQMDQYTPQSKWVVGQSTEAKRRIAHAPTVGEDS